MRRVVLAVLFVPAFAAAQTYTESEKLSGWSPKAGGGFERNPYNPAYQSTSRELVPYSGGVRANTAATLTGPAGSLPVVARSKLSNRAIGAAAARVAARAIPTVAVGIAIWDIYDNLRIRPDGAGGLSEDAGQAANETPSYTCQVSNRHVFTGSTPWAACSQSLEAEKASYTDPFYGSSKNWMTTSNCQVDYDPLALTGGCSRNFNGGGAGQIMISATWTKSMSRICPAVVDFSNPIYSVPGGPAGPDGKCPTGRYDRPITVDQAADRYEAYPPLNPVPVVQDIWARKGEIDATPEDIQGPASQVGSPQTTTTSNPDGSSRVETKTPSYGYSYSPTTINYSTTVTTTVNNAGNITTSTTTTNNEAKQDPEDQCVKNPDTVGCAKMDVPAGPDLDTQEKTVSVTPDAGWGGDGGSCPAPLQTTVLGTPVVVDNTLFCQFLSGIRFAVIGVCGLIATLIFVGGFKES